MQAMNATTRAQAGLAPSRIARPRQQAAAAGAARVATQKQSVARNAAAIARRPGAARAAAASRQRVAVGGVFAKAGGDVLVVGSSGQTAARVVVNLLRSGFKVTAGTGGLGVLVE